MPIPRSLFPMSRLLTLLLLTLVSAPTLQAQGVAPWEQRVAYEMAVDLDAPNHTMTGTQRLTYTNNSPYALDRAYWHLYFNAFQPQSMMAERNRNLPDPDGRVVPRIFELGPDEVGFHNVTSLTMNGQPVPFKINDTLLRADLPTQIAPGATVVFEMVFDSQVPLQTRRSGRDSREGIDYSMSQWYPKMAHYDSRGWHADPYVGREFVAPFGSWDVRITLPSEYTIGSTGVLVNPDEIGHGYSDRTVTHAPGSRLTWHFQANDVHDFAWAADPDYLHDRVVGDDGVTYHLLYQPDVAEGWEFMKRFVPAVIGNLSANIGPYAYPQFTVAQAGDGGMEYPMINFITGGRTANSLIGVTVHEAAHEWFYAMIANNENDYPWFDEGFTSYWTDQVIANLLRPGAENIHDGATEGIIRLQRSGVFEPLNTPADFYHTNRAYGTASYSGGQNVARLLGSVIGEEALSRFWKELYRQHALRHIEPADVERVAEQVSGMELDWFFWQLTQSARQMDYELDEVENSPGSVTIEIDREDAMIFPVDLRLTLASGDTVWVHVPTSETQGHRPVADGWIVAEPWPWTYEEWDVTIPVASRVVKAELDPLGKTPDYNRLNNASRTPRTVDFFKAPRASRDAYAIGIAPVVDYNQAVDYGYGIGVQVLGEYIEGQHGLYAMLKLWPERLARKGLSGPECTDFFPADVCAQIDFDRDFGLEEKTSVLEGIDYAFRYGTSPMGYSERSRVGISFEKHVGTLKNQIWGEHTFGGPQVGRPVDRGTLRFEATHVNSPWTRAFIPYNDVEERFGSSSFGGLRGIHELLGSAIFTLGKSGGSSVMARLDAGGSIGNVRDEGFQFDTNPFSAATRLTVTADYLADVGPLQARAGILLGIGSNRLSLHRAFRLGQPSEFELWDNAATRTVLGVTDESYDVESVTSRSALGFDLTYRQPLVVGVSPYGPVGYTQASEQTAFGRFSTPAFLPASRTVQASLSLASPALLEALPLRLGVFAGAALHPVHRGLLVGDEDDGNGFFGGEAQDLFNFDNFYADGGLSADLNFAEIPLLRRLTGQYEVFDAVHLTARLPFYVREPSTEQVECTDELGNAIRRCGPPFDEIDFSRFLIGIVIK